MTEIDVHHLAAAYALDALDDRERMAFEGHYGSCEVCHTDVQELSRIRPLLPTDQMLREGTQEWRPASTAEPPMGPSQNQSGIFASDFATLRRVGGCGEDSSMSNPGEEATGAGSGAGGERSADGLAEGGDPLAGLGL